MNTDKQSLWRELVEPWPQLWDRRQECRNVLAIGGSAEHWLNREYMVVSGRKWYKMISMFNSKY